MRLRTVIMPGFVNTERTSTLASSGANPVECYSLPIRKVVNMPVSNSARSSFSPSTSRDGFMISPDWSLSDWKNGSVIPRCFERAVPRPFQTACRIRVLPAQFPSNLSKVVQRLRQRRLCRVSVSGLISAFARSRQHNSTLIGVFAAFSA